MSDIKNEDRIHVQHYHTLTSTDGPSSEDLFHGEIAVGAKKGDEALYIRNSEDEICKFITEEKIDEKIASCSPSGSVENTIKITYDELKELRNAQGLKPGTYYRITDYSFTTTDTNRLKSAEHTFDIIVLAIDESTLSENAHAALHEGDTYFKNNDLNAWELKYSIDNKSRFNWVREDVEEKPKRIYGNTCGTIEEIYDNTTEFTHIRKEVGDKVYYCVKPPTTEHINTEYLIEDMSDKIVAVTRENPNSVIDMEVIQLICIDKTNGVEVATLENLYDGEFEDQGYINFGREMGFSVSMEFTNEEVDIAGEHYYLWRDHEDYSYVGCLVEELERNGYITTGNFDGDVDSLYYALTEEHWDTKWEEAVYMLYSTETETFYHGEDYIDIDYVGFSDYAAPRKYGCKGVIYSLTDEFNNTLPFDFKNVNIKIDNEWKYVFDVNNSDNSLTGKAVSNSVVNASPLNTPITIPSLLFGVATFRNNQLICPLATNYATFIFKGGSAISRNVIKISKDGSENRVNGNLVNCNLMINGEVLTINKLTNYCNIYTNGDVYIDALMYFSNFNGRGKLTLVNSNNSVHGALISSNIKLGVKSGSDIKLIMNDKDASSSNGARNVILDATNWGTDSETVIDISHLYNNTNTWNIAKNSKGEIKQWCEADLIM